MKKTITILFMLCISSVAFSQADTVRTRTETYIPFNKKKWYVPLAEVTALNVLVNRFDVYALNADWARITFSSWKTNLKRGFASDGDNFVNNFLAHPIHGSLYFNSARSLGYSFWESSAYTLGGSLMWEFLGETYAASEIDVNTTVQGGMYLGEMTHRISKVLLRNGKHRPNKFLRTAAAVALNPMGQFNRWLYKDVNDYFYTEDQEESIIKSQLSLGVSIPTREFDRIDALSTLHINYSLMYGNIFDRSKDGFKPFDSFVLRSWLDIGTSDSPKPYYLNIVSQAAWYKKSLGANNVLSVSQHYEYIENQAFKVGTTGITVDYSLRHNYVNWGFVGTANLGIIPFGSSSSTVVEALNLTEEDGELNLEYVYGRGYLYKLNYLIYHTRLGRLTSSYSFWYLNTENHVQGIENTNLLQFKYYYPVTKDYSLSIEFFKYGRVASYVDIPEFENIKEDYEEIKVSVTRTF